jgi:hypothetical protein
LNIEAFVFDGRHYIDFPPLPSLFRMPILAVTDRFDGRATGISIAIAEVAPTTLIGLLMWRVRAVMRGPRL